MQLPFLIFCFNEDLGIAHLQDRTVELEELIFFRDLISTMVSIALVFVVALTNYSGFPRGLLMSLCFYFSQW